MVVLPLFIFFLTFSASAFRLEEKDLEQLISRQNGRIASGMAAVESRQAVQGHLQRSFLPRLQADLGHEFTDGMSEEGPGRVVRNRYGYAAVQGTVNVFNGGRDMLRDKVLRARTSMARTDLDQSRFGVLTKARATYWQLLYQKEVIAVLEAALKMNLRNLDSAKKKIRNNLATKTDEIDFNQTQIQLEQDLRKARILLKNLGREMAGILGHDLTTTYELPVLNLHRPDHELEDFGASFEVQKHRDIRALGAGKSAAEGETELLRRWAYPQIDLYAGKTLRFGTQAELSRLDQEEGEVLGVKLSFVFDGFQSRTSSVAEAYQVRSLQVLKDQRALELEASYTNAFELYVLNHDLVHSAEENNLLAQKYFDSVWAEYNRGVKNSPDVLQAFQRVVTAKIRYAEIKKDYQVARAQLLGFLEK